MALRDYRTALVTGASSGIGEATVKALTAQGIEVHAVARRGDRLQALAQANGCRALVLDLRDTQGIYAALDGLEIDLVINNAGLGRGMTSLFDAPKEDVDATIDTNVTALYHVLKATVPGMIRRQRGHVVNVGSVAGLYPISSAVYGGSKGAVHLLSQNLRLELRGTGVRVSEICPGRVATEFFDAAIDDPAIRDKTKRSGIEDLTAADVADAIVYAVGAPWQVNVSLIELQPNEQSFGGFTMTPVAK